MYDVYIENVITKFDKMNIVKNAADKWGKEDYIQRRDVFKMVYSAVTNTNELIDYDYFSDEYHKVIQKSFVDVEYGTDDYRLLCTFLSCNIMSAADEKKAAFNEYATYSQILDILYRMLYPYNIDLNITDCYEYAEQSGLINSDDIYDYTCINADKTKLDNYIKAYDCIGLINKALYIPTDKPGYRPYPGMRYITLFSDYVPCK